MDSIAYLAIYAKLQKIYNDSDSGKFLSFPVYNHYSFSPDNLSPLFKDSAAEAALSLEKTAEFSRLVNSPVKDLSFPTPGNENYLWEVYDEILRTAIIADQNKTESEIKAYNEAFDFLYTKDEFELKKNTAIYNAYCDYQDRYYILKEQLGNLTTAFQNGERDEDAITRKKTEISNLETEWNTQGHKSEVERRLTLINNFEASSPAIIWGQLQAAFNKDTSLQKSLTNSNFAPTYLYPFDALAKDWFTITISRSEIDSLCEEAPHNLKSKLGTDKGSDEIESISFEYRSVLVQRPWIDFSVFKSRMWRFPSHSNYEAISYGSDSFAGKFPAYVCALLLSRNLKVTYKSGRCETSFTGNSEGSEAEVSILAYICKGFPLCPNPDLKAAWPTEIKTAMLHVQKLSGGIITAYNGDVPIGNGQVDVGSVIKFCAKADPGYILTGWSINGVIKPNHDYTIECEMTENGLKVIPKWEITEKEEGIIVKTDGTTLFSLEGAPKTLDMNMYSNLCNIKVISSNAFKNSPELCSVIIGDKVEIIGENAFSSCKNLESITIPKNTRTIHRNAFARDNYLNDPIIKVDPENEIYGTVNGILEEKTKIRKYKTIHCKCGTAFFYDTVAPVVCPNCNAQINISNSKEENIRVPDSKIVFKLNKDESVEKIKKYISNKSFVSPEFMKVVESAELELRPVYVPYWEWNMQAIGKFTVTGVTIENTGEKDANGKDKTKEVNHEYIEDVSSPENVIQSPSSRVVKNDVLCMNSQVNEEFSFNDAPENTTFELYSRNMKESQKDAEEKVIKTLKDEAIKKHAGLIKAEAKGTVDFVKESCRLTLVPIWIGSLAYKDKPYTFYINGYTGSVTIKNSLPKNWKLIGIIAGVIAAIIAIITLIIIL
jgi:hypothetical protein